MFVLLRVCLHFLLEKQPCSVLISAHDIPMVSELFERTIVIEGGEIVFNGLTGDLFLDVIFLKQHGLETP